MIEVQITNLDGTLIPNYETEYSSGVDLRAYVVDPDGTGGIIEILPNTTHIIQTGLQIAIPIGYEAEIRSRSGLAAKKNLFVLNSPGTIDADYRGELLIILHNIGTEAQQICHGDRIAQMVFKAVEQATFVQVEVLPSTDRGEGGLGSTGIK